jgi:hypothetical protein
MVIARLIRSREIIPFLGAGASLAGVPEESRMPNGSELAKRLVEEMEEAYKAGSNIQLAQIAQYYEFVFDRDLLYDKLFESIGGPRVDTGISAVARLLATVPESDESLHIVTTNFDTLVEDAFRAAGRDLCVITQNVRDSEMGLNATHILLPSGEPQDRDSLFTLESLKLSPGTAILFKMHGSAARQRIEGDPRDNLIVTEDDYVDFIVHAGTPRTPNFPPNSLLATYKQKRFLFLGYSLQDWNFRAFLQLLSQRNAISSQADRKHWAIQLHAPELDAVLWGKRNVDVYQGDLVTFCERLSGIWRGSDQ